MELDVLIEDWRWAELGLEALSAQAVHATLAQLDLPAESCALSVLGADDARVTGLNSTFRDKSTPTNVLSWPAADLGSDMPGGPPARPLPGPDGLMELGDIALAYDTCLREAGEQQKTPQAHVSHLLVHGTLHLLGYDHENDADAAVMEQMEREILGKMGIDDPYS